jgi:hypothetical protein
MASTSRGWGAKIFFTLLLVTIVGGVAAGVWGVWKGISAVRQATTNANEVANPNLSDRDLDSLQLGGDEQFLFEGDAAEAVAEALDDAIPGRPTGFTEIYVFTDYAIATAEDPRTAGRFDRYIWRGGTVGEPSPEQDNPDMAGATFTVDEIDWNAITDLVEDADTLTSVESGEVNYFIVSRDTFVEVGDVVVRIYVNGPRGSAVIEATANGEVVRVF